MIVYLRKETLIPQLTLHAMEVHAEELDVNGLKIRIYVTLSEITKHYTVFCKAFDLSGALLWATEVLDKNGKPRSFYSLTQAISNTRTLFGVYKANAVKSV